MLHTSRAPKWVHKGADKDNRQPANTRIGAKRVHLVRTRGGNRKFRALRLDTGNFSWGSEAITRKTRVIGVVYHPCAYTCQYANFVSTY